MKNKECRNIKIYGMSGYKYKATPAIMMKGKWLKELGFDIGGYISVKCENGRLLITPDAERAALKEADAAFMEKETGFCRRSEADMRCFPEAKQNQLVAIMATS